MSTTPQSDPMLKYRTHRETVRFTLEWAIENFTTFRDQTNYLHGPGVTMAELGLKDDYKGRWCIHVRPCFKQTVEDVEKKFLAISLALWGMDTDSTGCSDERIIPVEFSPRVTTGKTDTVKIRHYTGCPLTGFSSSGDKWGWDAVVSHDKLFGTPNEPALLKDDCINVALDVVVYTPPRNMQIPQSVVLSAGKDYQNFASRLLNWFTSQQQRSSSNLDFVLQSSDGKELHTSRWILMAHSPVFAAMLKEGSLEQKESRCEMADVDGETAAIMLEYIIMYGCSMHNINKENVEKVLMMADKYELLDLLHACEELLAINVTGDKAVHLLIVASQRGLEKLKAAALNVIPKNMATVLKNVEQEDSVLLQADPDLMQTIMEHCSKKMRLIDEA